MKSPFPGMDPYLEARWPNVHTTLVAAIQESLQPALPPGLRARAEERVLLETADDDDLRQYRSDVAVVDTGGAGPAPKSSGTGPSTVEPVVIDFQAREEVDRWVQIIDTTNGNRVVTAIEIPSPGNKSPGRLNQMYLRKLEDYRRGAASVVEIDLLRQPTRSRLLVRTEDLPVARRAPYLVSVRRAWQPWQWSAYPLPLRDRLPRIPIPLRKSDAEVPLDLQQLIERAYAAGGHDDIDYRKPPDPPLSADDTVWARERVAGR